MSEEKKYRTISAEDIEKYHKGLLTPTEMHELERAALDDPFLADALEGYTSGNENIQADISQLQSRLSQRIADGKLVGISPQHGSSRWWKVAAAVTLVALVGILTYRLSSSYRDRHSLARVEAKKANQPVVPSASDSVKEKNNTTAKVIKPSDSENGLVKTLLKRNDASEAAGKGEEKKMDVEKDIAQEKAPVISDQKKANEDVVSIDALAAGSVPSTTTKKPTEYNRLSEAVGNVETNSKAFKDKQRINYFHGQVLDNKKNPLPFANITNTRDNVGTYSDVHGNFVLISPDSVLDVQVRSVGFDNSLTRLKNNVTNNEVVLQDDKKEPDKILSFAKADTNRSRKETMKVEELEPADGWSNYNTYLANNIVVPEDVGKKQANPGHVNVSFEVNKDGKPVNLEVEKSLCQKCDEEAVRLIKEGPKWKKKNKKAKRITIAVPFDGEQ